MSDVTVYVVVEGQTEQTFIRDVLAPFMAYKGVFLRPALIGKPGHKGGDVRFDRASKDIKRFLQQRNDTVVSSMFDYFRLHIAWPGYKESRHCATSIEKGKRVEEATQSEIAKMLPGIDIERRFVPYISMFEFEAVLFSDVRVLAEKTGVSVDRIEKILEDCGSPEEINDRPQTAPSKRLKQLCQSYRKVSMGKTISESIGVELIRQRCPHFNAWIEALEARAAG